MISAEMKKKKEQIKDEQVNELRERVWAVISFDRCIANDLTYAEAESKLKELVNQKFSGLCIVSNAAADRIGQS